jgi:hypothetical protein
VTKTIYIIETERNPRVAYRDRTEAEQYLTLIGYQNRQPDPDIDPAVRYWRRGPTLARIVPVDLI